MPTAGVAAAPVAEAVDVTDVGVDVGVVEVADALLDADPVADAEVLDAGAEKDVLVDGEDCVGAEDRLALVVGRAERVA
jgi:hypothetical protein